MIKTSSQILEGLSSMPLSDLPQYIEGKRQEKDVIEQEIVMMVKREQSINTHVIQLLSDLHTTQNQFSEFTSAKNELQNYGLDVNDIHRFASAIRNASHFQFDGLKITTKLSIIDSLEKRENELQESIAKLKEIIANAKAYDKEVVEAFNPSSFRKESIDKEIQILEKQKTELQEWLDEYFTTTRESLEVIMKKFRGNIFGINRYLRNMIFNLRIPISNPDINVDRLDTREEFADCLRKFIDPNSSLLDGPIDFDLVFRIVCSRSFTPEEITNGIPLKNYLDRVKKKEEENYQGFFIWIIRV